MFNGFDWGYDNLCSFYTVYIIFLYLPLYFPVPQSKQIRFCLVISSREWKQAKVKLLKKKKTFIIITLY